jgi:hypothetical protein
VNYDHSELPDLFREHPHVSLRRKEPELLLESAAKSPRMVLSDGRSNRSMGRKAGLSWIEVTGRHWSEDNG